MATSPFFAGQAGHLRPCVGDLDLVDAVSPGIEVDDLRLVLEGTLRKLRELAPGKIAHLAQLRLNRPTRVFWESPLDVLA
jgi:hypothetical protein